MTVSRWTSFATDLARRVREIYKDPKAERATSEVTQGLRPPSADRGLRAYPRGPMEAAFDRGPAWV